MEQVFDTIITPVAAMLGVQGDRTATTDVAIVVLVTLVGLGVAWGLAKLAPVLLRSVDLRRVGVGLVLVSALVFVIVAALTGAFE